MNQIKMHVIYFKFQGDTINIVFFLNQIFNGNAFAICYYF